MTSDADVLFTGAVSTVVVVVSSSMVLGGVLRGVPAVHLVRPNNEDRIVLVTPKHAHTP